MHLIAILRTSFVSDDPLCLKLDDLGDQTSFFSFFFVFNEKSLLVNNYHYKREA